MKDIRMKDISKFLLMFKVIQVLGHLDISSSTLPPDLQGITQMQLWVGGTPTILTWLSFHKMKGKYNKAQVQHISQRLNVGNRAAPMTSLINSMKRFGSKRQPPPQRSSSGLCEVVELPPRSARRPPQHHGEVAALLGGASFCARPPSWVFSQICSLGQRQHVGSRTTADGLQSQLRTASVVSASECHGELGSAWEIGDVAAGGYFTVC